MGPGVLILGLELEPKTRHEERHELLLKLVELHIGGCDLTGTYAYDEVRIDDASQCIVLPLQRETPYESPESFLIGNFDEPCPTGLYMCDQMEAQSEDTGIYIFKFIGIENSVDQFIGIYNADRDEIYVLS